MDTIQVAGREYHRHPASAIYSELGVDQGSLQSSIAHHGQLEPIVIMRNEEGLQLVIDGWQRLTAIQALEADGEWHASEPMFALIDADVEPYRYAAAKNVARRQMTRAQRARVAWRHLKETDLGLTDTDAAKMMNVTKSEMKGWRDIERVAAGLEEEHGAQLIENVESGAWPYASASRICKAAMDKKLDFDIEIHETEGSGLGALAVLEATVDRLEKEARVLRQRKAIEKKVVAHRKSLNVSVEVYDAVYEAFAEDFIPGLKHFYLDVAANLDPYGVGGDALTAAKAFIDGSKADHKELIAKVRKARKDEADEYKRLQQEDAERAAEAQRKAEERRKAQAERDAEAAETAGDEGSDEETPETDDEPPSGVDTLEAHNAAIMLESSFADTQNTANEFLSEAFELNDSSYDTELLRAARAAVTEWLADVEG